MNDFEITSTVEARAAAILAHLRHRSEPVELERLVAAHEARGGARCEAEAALDALAATSPPQIRFDIRGQIATVEAVGK